MEVKNSEGPATIFVRSFNFTLHNENASTSIINKIYANSDQLS